jgi:hypothetical protein
MPPSSDDLDPVHLGELPPRCGCGLVGAGAAPAEDLKMVLNVAKSVLVGDMVGPSLDGGSFDLYGAAAVAADEVVVVAHGATSVGVFAVVGAD